MKNKKTNKLLIILTFIIIALAIVAGSYAFFTALVTGQDTISSISIRTNSLTLTYNGNISSVGNIEKPNDSFTSKFTVENTSNVTINSYIISFSELTNTITNNEYVYSLSCVSYANYGTGSQAVSGTCSGKSETPIPNTSTALMLTSSPIAADLTHEYSLLVTFKDIGTSQDYNQGKGASFKLIIE